MEDSDLSVPLEVNPAAGRKRARQANRTPRVDVAELLWTHEASRTQGLTQALDASLPVDNEDVGEIAVLQDNGDLDRARQPVRSQQTSRCASRPTAAATT